MTRREGITYPTQNELSVGQWVEINCRYGDRITTVGRIGRMLTKSMRHPHGIKVQLENGDQGRVSRILPKQDESKCPACKGGLGQPRTRALSRVDNKTELCGPCGNREGLILKGVLKDLGLSQCCGAETTHHDEMLCCKKCWKEV